MRPSPQIQSGHITDAIAGFGQLLRRAGLPVGPSRIVDAVRAVQVSGIERRDDFFWALHSVFVSRHDHHAVFKVAFEMFWRAGARSASVTGLNKSSNLDLEQKFPAAAARVSAAIMQHNDGALNDTPNEYELDLTSTFSDREALVSKDFAQMNAVELAEAKRAMKEMVLPVAKIRTRRFQAANSGSRLDMRRMMRTSLANGGEWVAPVYQRRRDITPPIVALCDISGSMSQYSRLFLHFLHALSERQTRVHSFVFGTRLTNISRALMHRDPDEALEASAGLVPDWSGGTRIASALKDFNRHWSRRVLGQGATVLLITDGLERDENENLAFELQRLHKSSRHLIWLNPLLRYDGFEARAGGIRAMLPFVDQFRPIHSLNAVSDLCQCLSQPQMGIGESPKSWLEAAA